MVPLGRVCDRAAGQKRAAQECQPFVVFLQHAVVDMQRDVTRGAQAELREDLVDLLLRFDGKDKLAGLLCVRLLIEGEAEDLFHEPRQAVGQIAGFGRDADQFRGKCIAVKQDPIQLSRTLLAAADRQAAELLLDI